MKYIKLFENFNSTDPSNLSELQDVVHDIFIPFMDHGEANNTIEVSECKFDRLDKKMVTTFKLLKETFNGIHISLNGDYKINKESLNELNDSIKQFENYSNYKLNSIFCTLPTSLQVFTKSRYAWFDSPDTIIEYIQEKEPKLNFHNNDKEKLQFRNISLAFENTNNKIQESRSERNIIIKSIESKINYELIEDIKYLSLDYLDKGLALAYNVSLESPEYEKHEVNIISASIRINTDRSINWLKYMNTFLDEYKDYNFIQNPKLTYDFKIFSNEGIKLITDDDASNKVLALIKNLYPDENISMDTE
jgi:hypothetical protein